MRPDNETTHTGTTPTGDRQHQSAIDTGFGTNPESGEKTSAQTTATGQDPIVQGLSGQETKSELSQGEVDEAKLKVQAAALKKGK